MKHIGNGHYVKPWLVLGVAPVDNDINKARLVIETSGEPLFLDTNLNCHEVAARILSDDDQRGEDIPTYDGPGQRGDS